MAVRRNALASAGQVNFSRMQRLEVSFDVESIGPRSSQGSGCGTPLSVATPEGVSRRTSVVGATTSVSSAMLEAQDSYLRRKKIRTRTNDFEAIINDFQENETLLRDRIKYLESRLEDTENAARGDSGRTTPTHAHRRSRRNSEESEVDRPTQREMRKLLCDYDELQLDKQMLEKECEHSVKQLQVRLAEMEGQADTYKALLTSEKMTADSDRSRLEAALKELEEKTRELMAVKDSLHVRSRFGSDGAASSRITMVRKKTLRPKGGLGASLFDELDQYDSDEDESELLKTEVLELREELEELRDKLSVALLAGMDTVMAGTSHEQKAAVMMQRMWRGFCARRRVRLLRTRLCLTKLGETVMSVDTSLSEVLSWAAAVQHTSAEGSLNEAGMRELKAAFETAIESVTGAEEGISVVRETAQKQLDIGTALEKPGAMRLLNTLNNTEREIELARGVLMFANSHVQDVVKKVANNEPVDYMELTQHMQDIREDVRNARNSVGAMETRLKANSFSSGQSTAANEGCIELRLLREELASSERQLAEAREALAQERTRLANVADRASFTDRASLRRADSKMLVRKTRTQPMPSQRRSRHECQAELNELRRKLTKSLPQRNSREVLEQSECAGDTGGAGGVSLNSKVEMLKRELEQAKRELLEAMHRNDEERFAAQEPMLPPPPPLPLTMWERFQSNFARMVCCRDSRPIVVNNTRKPIKRVKVMSESEECG